MHSLTVLVGNTYSLLCVQEPLQASCLQAEHTPLSSICLSLVGATHTPLSSSSQDRFHTTHTNIMTLESPNPVMKPDCNWTVGLMVYLEQRQT